MPISVFKSLCSLLGQFSCFPRFLPKSESVQTSLQLFPLCFNNHWRYHGWKFCKLKPYFSRRQKGTTNSTVCTSSHFSAPVFGIFHTIVASNMTFCLWWHSRSETLRKGFTCGFFFNTSEASTLTPLWSSEWQSFTGLSGRGITYTVWKKQGDSVFSANMLGNRTATTTSSYTALTEPVCHPLPYDFCQNFAEILLFYHSFFCSKESWEGDYAAESDVPSVSLVTFLFGSTALRYKRLADDFRRRQSWHNFLVCL